MNIAKPFPFSSASGRRWAPVLVSLLTMAPALPLDAQPDCRSVLGAHLKPLTRESPFSWAGEIVTIPAYLENRFATNSMLFGGFDFTSRSKTHQIYLEGGAKRSSVDTTGGSSATDHVPLTSTEETGEIKGTGGKGKPGTTTGTGDGLGGEGATATATVTEAGLTKYTYGWRELYYQYRAPSTALRAGLSTTRLGDYFLVNERTLGLNYRQKIGRTTFDATVGTVGEFARMTEFCGTKRLTNLVDKEKYETVSEDFGETNLAGVVATWDLRRPSTRPAPAGGDEFSFSDDLAQSARKPGFALNTVGVVAYHELDTRTDLAKSWVGGLLQAGLPLAWSLKTQVMYQNGSGPEAVIYYALAERDLFWANASNTSIHVGYFGKHDLNGPARFEASFTNLFQGEIMRMDAIDVPLLFMGVRHNFPSRRKLYLQLQGVRQIKAERVKEVDLEVGADFFKHLRVVAIGSYVYSTVTRNRENLVGKMEIRYGF